MSPSPHNKNLISYSRSVSTVRALCSLFSLFATRVFHNSFAHRRFRTLSKKCRVSLPPPPWFFKSYLSFASSGRSYRSLSSLFATNAFHNSFIHKRFRTLLHVPGGYPPSHFGTGPRPLHHLSLSALATCHNPQSPCKPPLRFDTLSLRR